MSQTPPPSVQSPEETAYLQAFQSRLTAWALVYEEIPLAFADHFADLPENLPIEEDRIDLSGATKDSLKLLLLTDITSVVIAFHRHAEEITDPLATVSDLLHMKESAFAPMLRDNNPTHQEFIRHVAQLCAASETVAKMERENPSLRAPFV